MGRILRYRRDGTPQRARDAGKRAEIVIFPRKRPASVVDTWKAINRSCERGQSRRLSDS